MKLIEALDIRFPKIISLVGAGGKTSFIFNLAKEAAGLGKSVLVTTTTAMFNPEYFETIRHAPFQHFDQMFIGHAGDLPPANAGRILLAAPALKAQGRKLAGYSIQDLAPLLTSSRFDLLLIEADGARMRPVKAPADHEPVIPRQTDMVVGCIGLDGLENPLDELHVHRPQILAKLSGQPMGEPVTACTLIHLIASDQGLFKSTGPDMEKTLVLNKADTLHRAEQGKLLGKKIISGSLADLVLVTCFSNAENPVLQKISL